MSDPLVIEVVRSEAVESVHLVDVAVVDREGRPVASAGEPARTAAFRSSAKPIQARVSREAGWEPQGADALALACASHNGEPAHVAVAEAMLAAAGFDESALLCPPALPFDRASAVAATSERRIYRDCSGKHAAMLAACVASGWDPAAYLDPGHPLQQRMRQAIEEHTGVTGMDVLVDGCGVPTFVAPLAALARAFVRIDDGGAETSAMRASPYMVGGTARLDTDLMAAANAVCAKSGAEGLLCLSDGEVGIALKSRDGAGRCRGPAALLVLSELGLIAPDVVDALAFHRSTPVLGGGRPVGALRARGALARR